MAEEASARVQPTRAGAAARKDMDHDNNGPAQPHEPAIDERERHSDAREPHTDAARRLQSRRHMLRRSLGTAAPVVLTLGSAPVAAGQCLSASGFVSAAAFHSRPELLGVLSCAGLSPSNWAQRAPYWPGGLKTNSRFHKEFGSKTLTPGFPESTTLLDVLQLPETIEAHVTAALLNAHRGGMAAPFEMPADILAVWTNIRANGGFYRPADPLLPALTEQGTRQWIAMSWAP